MSVSNPETTGTATPRPTDGAGNPVVRVALAGAGQRGQAYADWIRRHPEAATVVAVADPRPFARGVLSEAFPAVKEFDDWRELAESGVDYDAVVIATQDADHRDPALAFAARGTHILLEKPIAPTEEDTLAIGAAVRSAGVLFGVCHVLRYTPYTDLVKSVVDSGFLGRLMDIQHLEPVGWWHDAHSFVRGNWRDEAESAPMLLAKSCHDIDWISYVTGQRIEQVSSFGELTHFRPENKPAGAGDRCTECGIEPDCPYSALKIYPTPRQDGPTFGGKRYQDSDFGWPESVVADHPDEVLAAIEQGPYGECVYDGQNDVVDHQSVLMRLSGGVQGTFTMSAFTPHVNRRTRITGSHGYLEGDGEQVWLKDFRTGDESVRQVADLVAAAGNDAGSGHGGGDDGIIAAFVAAVAAGDPQLIRSGVSESVQSHLAVFAAEKARHTNTVQQVPAFPAAPAEGPAER